MPTGEWSASARRPLNDRNQDCPNVEKHRTNVQSRAPRRSGPTLATVPSGVAAAPRDPLSPVQPSIRGANGAGDRQSAASSRNSPILRGFRGNRENSSGLIRRNHILAADPPTSDSGHSGVGPCAVDKCSIPPWVCVIPSGGIWMPHRNQAMRPPNQPTREGPDAASSFAVPCWLFNHRGGRCGLSGSRAAGRGEVAWRSSPLARVCSPAQARKTALRRESHASRTRGLRGVCRSPVR